MRRGDARDKPGRGRSILGWLAVGPWLLALAAWLVGRVVGDRFLLTQYLEWIPTEAVVLSGLVAALIAGIVRGRRARRMRGVLAIVAAVTAWLVLAEWKLWRVPIPPRAEPDMRLVFMNISYGSSSNDLDPLFAAGGDIVIISNVHPNAVSFERFYGFPQSELLERTLGIPPGGGPPGEIHFLRHGSFRVMSRWPIRRRASARIGPQETWLEDDVQGNSGMLLVEIDAPEGPLSILAVDMPRVLGASRRDLMREAARRLDAVDRVLVADSLGSWRAEPRAAGDPLFSPAVIVGDFNTPGHAWSVSRFAPRHRAARADAGAGPAGTWPAPIPLFEIDLMRLGPGVRATATGRIRCDGCRHLGLWADLVR